MKTTPKFELIDDLIERIEKDGHGDREIDCRICYVLGMNWEVPRLYIGPDWRNWVQMHGFENAWITDHVYPRKIPNFTASLDAVYRLIWEYLPGHDGITLSRDPSGVGAEISNWQLSDPSEDYKKFVGKGIHCSEEIALLLAFFRALKLWLEHHGKYDKYSHVQDREKTS